MELFSFSQWPMQLKYVQTAVLAVLVLFACLLLPRLYRIFRAYRNLSQIPGPNIIFTILYFIKMARNGTTVIDSLNLLCGLPRLFPKSDIVRIWIGYKPLVMPCTPDLVKVMLTREESFERPPELQLILSIINMGNPLFLASPLQEWQKRRKLLNPAFHTPIIERYLLVFNKHAATFVEKVNQRNVMQPVDLLPSMQRCTLDIICEAAMGVDIESQKGNNVEFFDAVHKMSNIYIQRFFQPWLHLNIVFNCLPIGRSLQKVEGIINQMGRKMIADKKARMLSDPRLKKQIEDNFVECAKQMQLSFIDLLLYQHLYGDEGFSEEDILAEVNTFIFGGFDTCSLAISWALHLIGNYSRVQQAIHDELDTVLKNNKDRPISVADIKNLKYLNCVFQETLRLYPPGSTVFRYTQKDLQLNGCTIAAGTICLVLTDALHRNSRYFPKPDSFLPERFLDDIENRHPFAYIPFGAGPKNCLGQKFAHLEAVAVLASILRSFSVKSANTTDKVRRGLLLSTAPIDPLHVYLTPRWP